MYALKTHYHCGTKLLVYKNGGIHCHRLSSYYRTWKPCLFIHQPIKIMFYIQVSQVMKLLVKRLGQWW